jgi:hypothetical protein
MNLDELNELAKTICRCEDGEDVLLDVELASMLLDFEQALREIADVELQAHTLLLAKKQIYDLKAKASVAIGRVRFVYKST